MIGGDRVGDLYVHQVGADQEGFIDFYEREVLPAAVDLQPRALSAARA